MASSLKAKRSVVQSIVRTLDGWNSVGAAEVGRLDTWQRTTIGVTIVSGAPGHARHVAERVERHVWAQPDVTVLSIERAWWEGS